MCVCVYIYIYIGSTIYSAVSCVVCVSRLDLSNITRYNIIILRTLFIFNTFFLITDFSCSFCFLVVVVVGGVQQNMWYIHEPIHSIIGPYAYWQQRLLADVIALQQAHRALSDQVDRLTNQHVRLHTAIQTLSATVNRLEDVEQAYMVITSTQSRTIEDFEEQVKENAALLSKMQSGLRSNILQNILKVIIRSDTDGSLILDEGEINDLIIKFNTNKEAYQLVGFNEERFRYYMTKSGGSIRSIMDIIRYILNIIVRSRENLLFLSFGSAVVIYLFFNTRTHTRARTPIY